MPRVERTIIVQAPVDRVYQWWARMENLPQVLAHVRKVQRTGPFSTHWEAVADDGQILEWDAAIVQDLPQRQLQWESRGGPLPNRGMIDFEALSRDSTRLHIALTESGDRAHGPGGTALLGGDLDEALARFIAAMEAEMVAAPNTAVLRGPYLDLFLRAMAATAGVLLILGLAWSLVALIEVWVIIIGALLLGATLSPTVERLQGLRMPRVMAVSLVFLAVTAIATVGILSGIPAVMAQGQDLATALPLYIDNVQNLLAKWHARHPMIPVPQGTLMMDYLADQARQMLSNVFSLTGRVVWITVVVLSILFLALFILLDGRKLQDTMVRLIPIPQKSHIPGLLRSVEQRVGGYMLGLVFISIVAGVLTWWSMALLGVPYALLIGSLTMLLQPIPFVGPLVGCALAALLALSINANLALWTVIVYAIIQQVIGQFLFPLIMGHTIGMHPVWIAFALLVGGTLYGLTGAFLAIPVAIAVSIVIECYYLPWADAVTAEGSVPSAKGTDSVT